MREVSAQQKYLSQTFGLTDSSLQLIRDRLVADQLDFMSISPAEARILQFLVRSFGPRRIVEVGVLYGYSAACMAQVLPADGELICLESSETNYKIAKAHLAELKVACRVEVRLGGGEELLREIHGPIDMIFIDANKAGYCKYLDWAEKNVRRGGWIVGDNTFLFGAVYGENRDPDMTEATTRVMQTFNQRLADPKRYNSILIPTHEGMTVAQKLF